MYNSFDLKKDAIEQNKHQLQGVDLSGRDLGGINLGWAKLQNSKLKGTFLCGANLRSANLNKANLGEANLCNANLSYAELLGTNLKGANLERTDFSGTDLSGCLNLDTNQLKRSILNNATKLPQKIEDISIQIIEEDIDDISSPKYPTEVMDLEEEDKDSSAATFGSDFSEREESDSLDDEGPAITIIPLQETDESPLEKASDYESENQDYTFATVETLYPEETDKWDFLDTVLNKVLYFSFEDDEENISESISVNASEEETEKPTVNDPKPNFPENLERSEILTPVESAEAPEASISEPVESGATAETESIGTETSAPEPEAQKEMENAENKTILLADRLEILQKNLEKRLAVLELIREKRKTGHGS